MKPKEWNKYIERFEAALFKYMKMMGDDLSETLDDGLTIGQYTFMHHLSEKEKFTTTELAEKLFIKPSAITAMMDRLYSRGLVVRERDEKQDRRVVHISLSNKGHEVLKSCEKKRRSIIRKYLSRLTPEELVTLVHISERVAGINSDEKI